ncbi:hypothetical protein JGI7_01605 [Candidatus Kryptonium thompsonii]|uniref:Uncharacterized protein n=2 Tax=Candidatus Kryptonium thompsonii TaxID=1633631 RepID=A0A0P1LPC8_9BACT|nr:hypothetical protein [Candidatus Kryptonium thompsoni]CUS78037.1 hypothetical protein JGI15_10037 [Candidatus Kryptonium thompsoni]CUS78952.1 hypothetical protein JGI16_10159 [Candidatus Kryptonium thompsoni]CUS83428.1 hypothetical protein JGI10_00891 [Candidatus Kryptonium thompsoni]CUS84732.1 hypothetical protein JGI13_01097 [Candidatus Kryptonium thompsoni]CUS85757.1 hypothetical protein JGI6_01071 [Candidatus Kryptonium thompsoni]
MASILLVFIMFLNYGSQIFYKHHHHGDICHCNENCGCGCKGKVVVNLINSVCFDSEGCGCKKGQIVSKSPTEEGLIIVENKFSFSFRDPFLAFSEVLKFLPIQSDIFHPPEEEL